MKKIVIGILGFAASAHAVVISHSGLELKFKYEMEFRSLLKTTDYNQLLQAKQPAALEAILRKTAKFHSDHLFGLFQSPKFVKKHGIDPTYVAGLGGARLPITISNLKAKPGKEYVRISYQAEGKMLVHKTAALAWLKKGHATLPLLVDLPKVYGNPLKYQTDWTRCTDRHYWEAIDFHYFYDPFRVGCAALRRPPVAQDTQVKVERAVTEKWMQTRGQTVTAKLQQIRGDNANGSLFVIHNVVGFAETRRKTDDGYQIFKGVSQMLEKSFGFTRMQSGLKAGAGEQFKKWLGNDAAKIKLELPVRFAHPQQGRYLETFVKDAKDQNDQPLRIVYRLLLVDTEMDLKRPTKTFPSFWKEAWEQGDFIQYGGHSGGGENLARRNIGRVLERYGLTNIQHRDDKRQIAFIDGCSTYSYYLDPYKWTKAKRKNIELLTYALPSIYDSATYTTRVMLTYLVDPKHFAADPKWAEILRELEIALARSEVEWELRQEEGRIRPAKFKKRMAKYISQNKVPSYLVSVGAVW